MTLPRTLLALAAVAGTAVIAMACLGTEGARGSAARALVETSPPPSRRAVAPPVLAAEPSLDAHQVHADPGEGWREPAEADAFEVTRAQVEAEESALAGAIEHERLRAVEPRELGYASVDAMHAAVRDRLGIAADRPIRVVHDEREGQPVVTVTVAPREPSLGDRGVGSGGPSGAGD